MMQQSTISYSSEFYPLLVASVSKTNYWGKVWYKKEYLGEERKKSGQIKYPYLIPLIPSNHTIKQL